MTSEPARDSVTDHLLTPENATLVVIHYQPTQVRSIRSLDHRLLLENIVRVAKIGILFGAAPAVDAEGLGA